MKLSGCGSILLVLIVALGCLYIIGHYKEPKRDNPAQVITKQFIDVKDFVGTVWQNPMENSTIYFQDTTTIVYHMFWHSIYSNNPGEIKRYSGHYIFNPNMRGIAIEDLGDLSEIPLMYDEDKSGHKFLTCVPQNRGWQLEERQEIMNIAK